MEPWMHDVPRAVVAAQRQLRREVPELEARFRRATEALREEVAPEDYEVDFQGRARLEDLSPLGQMQMGLLPWA